MHVKLSICIVAYNNYKDIKNALSSLEKYTSPKLSKKIYIVDNGTQISEKSAVENFKAYLSKIRDVEYINTGENLGFGKGHNQVLPIIESDYHAIINPDIIFCEDAFSEILKWMDANPEVGMTIPCIINEMGKKQEVYRRELTVFDMFNRMFLKELFKKRAKKHTMQDMDFSKTFQVPFGQGSFLVIRSELFKKIGGFDDNFFMYVEDADLCKRVNQVSKLMYYPGARVIHKWEKGSHKNRMLLKYHVQSMIYYFRKWGMKIF